MAIVVVEMRKGCLGRWGWGSQSQGHRHLTPYGIPRLCCLILFVNGHHGRQYYHTTVLSGYSKYRHWATLRSFLIPVPWAADKCAIPWSAAPNSTVTYILGPHPNIVLTPHFSIPRLGLTYVTLAIVFFKFVTIRWVRIPSMERSPHAPFWLDDSLRRLLLDQISPPSLG